MKKIIIIVVLGLIGAVGLFVVTIRFMADKPREWSKSKTVNSKEFQNGDIIFQTSISSQSRAIQLATKSKYSHMGIIYESDGQYYIYEAVQPVKLTKLNEWIKRGANSHYVVKRLKDSDRLLTKENLKKMKDFGENYKSKNYDIYFEWSDDQIYCSDLYGKFTKRHWTSRLATYKN